MTYFFDLAVPQGIIRKRKRLRKSEETVRETGLMIETDWSQPVKSMALCVRKKQIPKARAWAASKGVPTDFTDDGEPIFRSRKHRALYCRIRGVVDNNGGYSDATKVDSEIMHKRMIEEENAVADMVEALLPGGTGAKLDRLPPHIVEQIRRLRR